MTTTLARLAYRTALVAALIVIDPPGARACSCLVQTSEEAFAGSTAVFLGTVRGVALSATSTSSGPLLEVEFDVTRVWKGDVTRRQVVITPTVCPGGFATGRSYLVYGLLTQYGLSSSGCSHTSATDQAAEDLGLGSGSAPLDNPDVAASAGMGCRAGGPGPAGGAAGPALLLLLGWLRRRLR